MSDAFTDYETGLNRLLTRLDRDHPRYTEALVLQQRLLENLARVHLYGDTETSQAERTQILDVLNRLALDTVGESFSALFPTRKWEWKEALIGERIIIGERSYAARVKHLRQRLQIARETGDLAAEGAALDDLGSLCEVQSDFEQAIRHYEQAIASTHKLGDRQSEAIYLHHLGLAFMRLADDEPSQSQSHFSHAVDALRQAMEVVDVLDVAPLLRARIRYHLGRCYHQLSRWREAITLLEQARETFSRHKTRPELAHALLELGRLYHQRQDFESAYIYLKDALRLFRRLEDTDGIAVAQEALGSLALQTARLPEAVASLQEARQGYATLRRSERIRAVDDLLRIAHQARQPVGGTAL